jgi:regulatory protein
LDIKSAIEHYCNYQPRCHKEVRNKLYELGCKTAEVEEYISELIQADILNEERFARAFARGKFRLLKWGKSKIINYLRFKQVSEYCIKKGLSEIDEESYIEAAKKLVEKKWKELKSEKNQFTKRAKTQDSVLQKGYEPALVQKLINEIIRKNKGG